MIQVWKINIQMNNKKIVVNNKNILVDKNEDDNWYNRIIKNIVVDVNKK